MSTTLAMESNLQSVETETVGHLLSSESEELAKLLSLCLGDSVWTWDVTLNMKVAASYVAKFPEVEADYFAKPGWH